MSDEVELDDFRKMVEVLERDASVAKLDCVHMSQSSIRAQTMRMAKLGREMVRIFENQHAEIEKLRRPWWKCKDLACAAFYGAGAIAFAAAQIIAWHAG